MRIDAQRYSGTCSCGKSHEMQTKLCIIEENCLKDLFLYVQSVGLKGKACAVFDTNTHAAVRGKMPQAEHEVVLPQEGLHADEHGVALLTERLPTDCAYLIAVGSGTVHDIVRYTAYQKEIPFVSCPTAASVDGFCSSVAAMTWEGAKKTLKAISPILAVADLSVIKSAPARLSRSGFGDMIGKFIALADWKIGKILKNEFYCERIASLTEGATKAVLDAAWGLARSETAAYEKLMYGLLLSGLAMQMLGNSRPASGAEHHISHLIETAPMSLGISSDALHGEKVGVATLLAAEEYHRLSLEGLALPDYRETSKAELWALFGEGLGAQLWRENKNDAALGIRFADIAAHRDDICAVIAQIPNKEMLLPLYERLGALTSLSSIGVAEGKRELLLTLSPLVRNRLTLMRLRRSLFI